MTNKELLTNFIEEVWNNQSLGDIEKYIHEDYKVHHTRLNEEKHGREFVKNNVQNAHAKYDHYKITIDDTLEQGDKIASRITINAKKDGRNLEVKEFMMHTVVDEKLFEVWSLGTPWRELS